MIIGNKKEFAIECYDDTINSEKKWVFGRMCLWCNNQQLGNINEPSCMLNVTVNHLKDYQEDSNNLENEKLNKLTDSELYSFLDNKLYNAEEETTSEQVIEDMNNYSKYDFLTNGGESFDGYASFIVKGNNKYRILFRDMNNQIYSGLVNNTVFTEVINGFIHWFKQKMG